MQPSNVSWEKWVSGERFLGEVGLIDSFLGEVGLSKGSLGGVVFSKKDLICLSYKIKKVNQFLIHQVGTKLNNTN